MVLTIMGVVVVGIVCFILGADYGAKSVKRKVARLLKVMINNRNFRWKDEEGKEADV